MTVPLLAGPLSDLNLFEAEERQGSQTFFGKSLGLCENLLISFNRYVHNDNLRTFLEMSSTEVCLVQLLVHSRHFSL